MSSDDRLPTGAAPRVLLVATDLSTGGGVNRVVVNMAEMLSDMGIDVAVANARSRLPSAYPLPTGVPLIEPTATQIGRRGYFRFLWALRRAPFDVVVGFWTHDNIALTLALLGSGKLVVATEHMSQFNQPALVRLLRLPVYRMAAALVVLNRREEDYYRRFLREVRLIPNAIAPGEQTDGPREKLVIGVGHLNDRKNFADLIDAMASSGAIARGWRLEIYGDGLEGPRLRAQIARLGLAASVAILPPTRAIFDVYRRAAIIALPSRIDPLPMVLAEAIMHEVLPIAYRLDGSEYMLEGFPDHVIPNGDAAALGAAIARFTAMPDRGEVARDIRDAMAARTATAVVARQWGALLRSLGLRRD